MEKNSNDNILKYIKDRFNRYRTYYQILSLNDNNITDEKVKQAYEKKCNELNLMLKDVPEEIKEEIEETIRRALDDAYFALKSEDSRRHYKDLLDNIKEME